MTEADNSLDVTPERSAIDDAGLLTQLTEFYKERGSMDKD